MFCVNKNAEYDIIANEIDILREDKAAVVTRDAEQEMLRRLNEKITLFDDKLIFEFKSSMTLELKR